MDDFFKILFWKNKNCMKERNYWLDWIEGKIIFKIRLTMKKCIEQNTNIEIKYIIIMLYEILNIDYQCISKDELKY